jgi:CAP12/Pycsar effector protein, TIR domain
MVIYGHDTQAKDALFDWLRAIGLQPREWNQLVTGTGAASPYIGQVLDHAFQQAQAVIALFTPDERVLGAAASPNDPRAWRLQARPNVLIEAGMALTTHPDRTVLALLGPQELPSDLAGRHYIRLNHTDARPLHDLAGRLRTAGCDADTTGNDWLNPARFPNRDHATAAPAETPNGILRTGERMSAGQSLYSPTGNYRLDVQADGNLVIHNAHGTPIRASDTAGTGNNNYLTMQDDGNLVLYKAADQAVWASNTGGRGNTNCLAMQNDGNLVIYTAEGKPIWASNDDKTGWRDLTR